MKISTQGVASEVPRYTLFDNVPGSAVFDEKTLAALARRMASVALAGSGPPAGYTYLGQFLIHDISGLNPIEHTPVHQKSWWEKSSSGHGTGHDPSPSLDLDTIYGGLKDPLNDARVDATNLRMKLGPTFDQNDNEVGEGDLLRHSDTTTAMIKDGRNDENLLVAQLHVLFLRLHNHVVQQLLTRAGGVVSSQVFMDAKDIVQHAYREIILCDYLYEVLDFPVWKAIILGNQNILWDMRVDEKAVIPVEFAAAAGRFGHAMVKSDYQFSNAPRVSISRAELFSLTGKGATNRSQPFCLKKKYIPDWTLFFDCRPPSNGPIPVRFPDRFNSASRINPSVTIVLKKMSTGEKMPLAALTLIRGNDYGLCSGQSACRYINQICGDRLAAVGITLRECSRDELNLRKAGHNLLDRIDPRLSTETPLWYYVLAEAAASRGKLGVLGSLIVAETIQGIRALTPVPQPNPELAASLFRRTKKIPGVNGAFLQMADIIRVLPPLSSTTIGDHA